jgi:4-coumarate--CoA ligase
MTELTCSFCAWDPNETSFSAAVGELNPNCSAKVMNEDGTAEVPRGSRGELWCRGPNVMKGYWRKPKETAETFHDGWLKTGDVAVLDEDNKIHIVDRIKELIKVKGNQVAPAELEALLLEHQALADAAVVGVTINGGEVPRAYVVLKEGQELTEKDIRNWMDDKVVRYKRLVGGIVFVDAIPKNPVSAHCNLFRFCHHLRIRLS